MAVGLSLHTRQPQGQPFGPCSPGTRRLPGGLSWRVQLQSELVFLGVRLSPGAERPWLPYTTSRGGKGAHTPLSM